MLAGRVALVTGASRGLGRAIAVSLADAGADVAVNFRSNKSEAEAVAEMIRTKGRRTSVVQADVSIPAEARGLVETVRGTLGDIDILVNNAGICELCEIQDLSLEMFQRTMETNVTSAFVVTQAVLPAMREKRWGRVMFLSSLAAQNGGVTGPAYAASKAALVGMMHSYSANLCSEGITFNAISPAQVESDMVLSNPKASPSRIPVGRFGRVPTKISLEHDGGPVSTPDAGRPEEVGQVAAMLAANGYMTNQTISVNGGMYATS